jgi:hypothetical protein
MSGDMSSVGAIQVIEQDEVYGDGDGHVLIMIKFNLEKKKEKNKNTDDQGKCIK